ncbi:MAG TPA: aldo/keto reductase [Micropepsaceae bacterium]|nr:aldo/keto reductase [Micropepsaceae bacterium]
MKLGQSKIEIGPLALGLWRFTGAARQDGRRLIDAALDAGMNHFDAAAVYGLDWGGKAFGEVEERLGAHLAEDAGLRARIVLATKCGITPGVPYDSSAEAIIASCEASLRRLRTDVIDLFYIHRPDLLAHPEEQARALEKLRQQGKIREVGVSNYNPAQTRALMAHLAFPLAATQPEFSALALAPMDDGVLDLCMEKGVTPMAWSPLAGGRLGNDASHGRESSAFRVTHVLDRLAQAHATSRSAMALAFVLAHPAKPVAIVGSQQADRLRQAMKAREVRLSRAEWYEILVASRGAPLP